MNTGVFTFYFINISNFVLTMFCCQSVPVLPEVLVDTTRHVCGPSVSVFATIDELIYM